MTGNRPVLVIGYSLFLLRELQRLLPENSVIFVEEPDVIRKRDYHASAAESPVCRALMGYEYLRPGAADGFYLTRPELDPVAVIPGGEYAVPVAARLAERYGVPGAGYGAALILRDKALTRTVTAAAGVPNPESAEVTTPTQARKFAEAIGEPVILKPANRQAAVGTVIVEHPDHLPAAWEQARCQDEGPNVPDRGIELRLLVERYVRGPEFSVEMLIAGGRRVFANVTAKDLAAGSHPVELGHLVPAPIPAAVSELLCARTEQVVAATGFGTGLVHCEWIVSDGTPYLVECAGRQPGDWIVELIANAYDMDLVAVYLDLMRGTPPGVPLPATASGGAAVRFLIRDPGRVAAIEGMDKARAVEGVRTCQALITVGAVIPELRSSWDRAAVVTACGSTAADAAARAEQALSLIEFVME